MGKYTNGNVTRGSYTCHLTCFDTENLFYTPVPNITQVPTGNICMLSSDPDVIGILVLEKESRIKSKDRKREDLGYKL